MSARRLRGICVACRKELYTDPIDHYTSDSHRLMVERAERREAKLQAKTAPAGEKVG